jgi:hypothetical protein
MIKYVLLTPPLIDYWDRETVCFVDLRLPMFPRGIGNKGIQKHTVPEIPILVANIVRQISAFTGTFLFVA